jgi:hypothetical protein
MNQHRRAEPTTGGGPLGVEAVEEVMNDNYNARLATTEIPDPL